MMYTEVTLLHEHYEMNTANCNMMMMIEHSSYDR